MEVVGRVAAPADCSLCKHGAHIEQPVQMAFLFEVLSFTWRKCEVLRDKFVLILTFSPTEKMEKSQSWTQYLPYMVL